MGTGASDCASPIRLRSQSGESNDSAGDTIGEGQNVLDEPLVDRCGVLRMGSMARYPATKRRNSSDSVQIGNSICSNRLAICGSKRITWSATWVPAAGAQRQHPGGGSVSGREVIQLIRIHEAPPRCTRSRQRVTRTAGRVEAQRRASNYCH